MAESRDGFVVVIRLTLNTVPQEHPVIVTLVPICPKDIFDGERHSLH